MATPKPKPPRKTAYVPQSQRHTIPIAIRASPELAEAVKGDAETYDLTLAEVLTAYRDLAHASGRLEKVLHAAGVREEHPDDYKAAVRGAAPAKTPVFISGKRPAQ